MGYPDTFEGFRVQDHKKWSDFKKETWKPKQWEDRDVDIEIECCGVCGSDVHTITGGWGGAPLPLCVGHEVIGKAVKVGDKCKTGVKVGDRVGVGAQISACLECNNCKSDNENYCPNMIDTYGAKWPIDGSVAQGGFASHIRAHEYFVFPIPDAISSASAASMMCAGLTVWSPLVRNKVGKGSNIAVVGLGGLGHYAVLWAVALGAEVTVLSHSPNKKEDALKLGAKHFVVTGEKDWSKNLNFTFDFILNTADATHKFNIQEYMLTLKPGGHFHNVGLPDEPLPSMKAQDFAPNGSYIGGSHIGNRPEMLSMLKLAAEKNIQPVIEKIPLSEAGCKDAVERVHDNKVRYRATLTDFNKVFTK